MTTSVLPIHADTKYWEGLGGNNRWNGAGNFAPSAPTNGDDLVFGLDNRKDNQNNINNLSIQFLTFTNGGFTLGPQTADSRLRLTITGGITMEAGVAAPNVCRLWMLLGGAVGVTNQASTSTLQFEGSTVYSPPGPVFDNQGYELTFAGEGSITCDAWAAILGSGGVTKVGAGTLTLLATNTYTGPTLVGGGRLVMSTAHAGGGSLSVHSGAALEALVGAAGTTLRCSDLVLGSVPGGSVTNDFNLGAFGNPTVPVIYATNLVTTGTVYVNVTGSELSTGQVALIRYEGGLGGDGFTFVLNRLPAGVFGYLSNNAVAPSVDLVLTEGPPVTNQPATRYWVGLGANNRWTQPGNWLEGVVPAAGDIVVFGTTNRLTANYDLTASISSNLHAIIFTNGGFNLAVRDNGESLLLGPGGMTVQTNVVGDNIYRIRTFLGGPRSIVNHSMASRLVFTPDNQYLVPVAICNEGYDLTFEGVGSFTFSFGTAAGTGVDGITGSGGVVMNGTGELLLNGTNTYTGPTVVNAGSLRMNTVYAGGGPITVANGATFGARVRTPGVSLNCASLTLGSVAAGAVTNEFDLGLLGNPVVPVIYATNLTTTGTVFVTVLGSGLAVGQFTLIQHEGSIGGDGFVFTLASLPAGVSGFLTHSPGAVDLVITNVIAQTPTSLSYALVGDTLELSWPLSHLGWVAQSNAVSVADPGFWFDIPGSETVTSLAVPINPVAPPVFYRLRLP